MFAPGPMELLVIGAIALVTIGVPITVVVLLILLVRRSNSAKRDDQRQDHDS